MLNARSWAPGGASRTRPGHSNPGSLGVPAPPFTVASRVGGLLCPFGSAEERREPRPSGRRGQSLGDSCSLGRPWGAAEGTATGAGAPPRAEVGRQTPGFVPRLETAPAPRGKSPREAEPAPGLQEEAAGDSAISRGLRGSGCGAGHMSYAVLRPGKLRWHER